MARTLVDTRLQDRAARARLAVRHEPHWRSLAEGAHVGYRRGKVKGTWVARYFVSAEAKYVSASIAEADDHREADGHSILNYRQAAEAAWQWISLRTRGGPQASNPDMTVEDAVTSYIAMRDHRRSTRAGRALRSEANYALGRHVLEDGLLPRIGLAELAESDLIAWQLRLVRTKPSSIQRVVNDLKAALNAAYAVHRKVLPADLPITVRYGLKVDASEALVAVARENQILADDQVRSVVAAAAVIDADLGLLVMLLAATGARFSQLARMTVGDVQADRFRLMVPQSYKGRRRVLEHVRVQVGADVLAALAPALEGRRPSAPLLERWRHRQTGPMTWVRVERGPWTTPSEMSRPWKEAVAAAGLPAATIPYALRHSSIVRGLRLGLPIRLVAALHDTSVAMIERHYSRWITEGLDELAARAVIPIVATAA